MKQFKILYLASEVAPFAKAGGLADCLSHIGVARELLHQSQFLSQSISVPVRK